MFVLRSNNSGFSLHIFLIVLASIAGVVIIGIFTKSQAEISKERKQFIAAQIEVNAIGDKLVATTKPDKHAAVAYCDYGHVTYGRGGRTCWAQYYLLYKDISFEKAQEKFFNNKDNLPNVEIENQGIFKGWENDARFMDFSVSKFSKKCSASLYYNLSKENPRYSKKSLGLGNPFELEGLDALVQLDCSGEAKAEHFPVKE